MCLLFPAGECIMLCNPVTKASERCVCLTLTVSVPTVLADSQSAQPAHLETSAASSSGYETHPARHRENTHKTLFTISTFKGFPKTAS